MASLIALAMVVATPVAVPSIAVRITRWEPYVVEASRRFGVPPAWIERVIAAESAGMTTLAGRPIRSSAGALGLMQVMPGTYDELRMRFGLGGDPQNCRDNILAGTAYLRLMYDRFGYPGLFAAYNAGPQRYAASVASGTPLPAETRRYLATVARPPGSAIPRSERQTLFASLSGDRPAPSTLKPRADGLFAVLEPASPGR